MVENRPMMMISIADYLPAKSRSPFLLPISSRQIGGSISILNFIPFDLALARLA